jgi:hypothetical protein
MAIAGLLAPHGLCCVVSVITVIIRKQRVVPTRLHQILSIDRVINTLVYHECCASFSIIYFEFPSFGAIKLMRGIDVIFVGCLVLTRCQTVYVIRWATYGKKNPKLSRNNENVPFHHFQYDMHIRAVVV